MIYYMIYPLVMTNSSPWLSHGLPIKIAWWIFPWHMSCTFAHDSWGLWRCGRLACGRWNCHHHTGISQHDECHFVRMNHWIITAWWWLEMFGTMEFYHFPYIGNVIIPTDFHMFRRGWNHQSDYHSVNHHSSSFQKPSVTSEWLR